MDWLKIAQQGNNVVQGSGLLNQSLNSYKNDNSLQGRINQIGSGITGEDPLMKFIKDIVGNDRKSLYTEIDTFGNNIPQSFNNDDLISSYNNLGLLKESKAESPGRLIGDNLLASAKGASAGLSVGGPWGALIGGVAGGLTNLQSLAITSATRGKLNENIREANANKVAGMNQNIDSVNTLNNYLNKSNMAAFGGQFESPISSFNNGGTHEQNANGGIQVGVGNNGLPNTVEEGEVRNNKLNYIYSDRIIATPEDLESVFIPKKYAGKSFAEIAKELSKELEDRPNDGPSRKSNEIMLDRLRESQEIKKAVMKEDVIMKLAKKHNMSPEELQMVIGEGSNEQQPQGQNQFLTGGTLTEDTLIEDEYINPINPISAIINSDGEVITQQQNNSTGNTDNILMGNTQTSPYPILLGNNQNSFKSLSGSNKIKNTQNNRYNELMMNAPILGGLATLGANLAKGPNYTNVDKILATKERKVSPALIRDTMTPDLVNSVYNQNQIQSMAARSRSKLKDSANGNAAIERASIIGSDANMFEALGKSIMIDNATNFERKKAAAEFNRAVNQGNADSINRANATNLESGMQYDQLMANALLQKQKIKDEYDAAISQNLSGIFQGISDKGRFKYNSNTLSSLFGYTIDNEGRIHPPKKP